MSASDTFSQPTRFSESLYEKNEADQSRCRGVGTVRIPLMPENLYLKTEAGHGQIGFGARHRTADQHARFLRRYPTQAAGERPHCAVCQYRSVVNMLFVPGHGRILGRVGESALLFRRARVLLSGSDDLFHRRRVGAFWRPAVKTFGAKAKKRFERFRASGYKDFREAECRRWIRSLSRASKSSSPPKACPFS